MENLNWQRLMVVKTARDSNHYTCYCLCQWYIVAVFMFISIMVLMINLCTESWTCLKFEEWKSYILVFCFSLFENWVISDILLILCFLLKESYCEVLHQYKNELSKPFDEATMFLTNIELELSNLCKGSFTMMLDSRSAMNGTFFFHLFISTLQSVSHLITISFSVSVFEIYAGYSISNLFVKFFTFIQNVFEL